MELKELTDRALELFGVDNPDNLGSALMESVSNTDKLKAFCDLVGGDLSIDWLQMIYQYYLADRKEKKQDYKEDPENGFQFFEYYCWKANG